MSTCSECRFIAISRNDDSCFYCTGDQNEVFENTNACSRFETHPCMITTCKDCVWAIANGTAFVCGYDNKHRFKSGEMWCRHFLKKENAE